MDWARPRDVDDCAAAVMLWLKARLMSWRTVQMFRDDRLLLWLTLATAFVSLLPMAFTPFLPLVDLGSNIGAAGLIDDLVRGAPVVSERYALNWAPIPYWSGYLLMGSIEMVFGAVFAVKATVAVMVVLLPLAFMRLLVALGRSPRIGLWAFLASWDVNAYWGWFTFQFGMALAIWAIAWLAEAKTLREHARIIPLVAVIALTHVHAVALVGVVGGSLAFVKLRPVRSTLLHALSLTGLLVLVPWFLPKFFRSSGPSVPFQMEQAALAAKIASLYQFSFDTFTSPRGVALTTAVFVLFLLAPAVLPALDWRPLPPPERSGAMALTFVLGCLALYGILPFSLSGPIDHWWTYPRFATYLLLGMLLLPTPGLTDAKAWLLAPGLVLVVGMNVERIRQFSEYGDHTRPYLEIMAAMRPHSKFLPLDYEFGWAGTRTPTLGQLHGYAAASTSSYDPHLFDHPSIPVLFRPEHRPPQPNFGDVTNTFSFEAQGKFYDYLIVYPLSRDTVVGLPATDVTLVKQAGDWRLYEVVRKSPVP